MKSLLALLLSAGALLAACAPSPAQIAAAIAATQTAAVTPTPPATATPAATLTPAPSPTPDLITARPRDLLPSANALPAGFTLQPESSGPLTVDGGQGYLAMYLNPSSLFNPSGDAILLALHAIVMDEVQSAHGYLVNFRQRGPQAASQLLPQASSATEPLKAFTAENADLPGADEAVLVAGTIAGPNLPATVVGISARLNNVVAVLYVAGPDYGDAQPALEQQARYYIALILDEAAR